MTDPTDLSELIPSDIGILHIVKPGTSEKTGWQITMAGPGHPKTVAFNNANERKRRDHENRIEAARINCRKYKPEDFADGESRKEFIEGLVSRIVTWTPVKIGQEVIEFSDNAAIELLLRPIMGSFVGQIVDYLIDERAFMKDSANG
ncbi:MAG TPA: hypothetical protein VII92_20885 [Anaerolineae bacterium]